MQDIKQTAGVIPEGVGKSLVQDIKQESTSSWEERFKEIMIEFDNNQRRFLGGLLHSTQFNIWFEKIFKSELELERQKAKEEVVKECLNILEQQNPINWDEEVNHYKNMIKNLSKQ